MNVSLSEFGTEIAAKYENILDNIVTPFDTILNSCLFENTLQSQQSNLDKNEYEV